MPVILPGYKVLSQMFRSLAYEQENAFSLVADLSIQNEYEISCFF